MAEHAEAATSGATFELSRFAVRTRFEDVPHAVTHEGVRAVVNWVGCVLGSSAHEAVLKAQDVLGPYAGPSEATVLGSGRRFNMMHAALFNSMSSSAHVFDDTHLRTVLHPTSPIGAAALAVAEHRRSSGQEFLMAVVLGNEVGCRVANMLMVPPAKSHLGLYITGIAGSVGAAVAAGRLMGLNELQMAWAIGIGASQGSGLRVMHGSHTTSFMPGLAARAGVTAGILAASNFTATERSLEAKRGLADVHANPPNIEVATDRLGQHYELSSLTYKPYPCGIVAHPVIEACLVLVAKHNIEPDQVDRIDAWVNPVAIDLTGIRHPRDGFQSHNSLYHWVAAAALFRRAGLREEADECVQSPAVKAFREKVYATADETMQPDACRLSITLRSGQKIEHAIDHCSGSEQRPMTESELDNKFIGQAETVLSPVAARNVLGLCRTIETVRDMGQFVKDAKSSKSAFAGSSHS